MPHVLTYPIRGTFLSLELSGLDSALFHIRLLSQPLKRPTACTGMTVRISPAVLPNSADSARPSTPTERRLPRPPPPPLSAAHLHTRMGYAFLSHKGLSAFNSHQRASLSLSSREACCRGCRLVPDIGETLFPPAQLVVRYHRPIFASCSVLLCACSHMATLAKNRAMRARGFRRARGERRKHG